MTKLQGYRRSVLLNLAGAIAVIAVSVGIVAAIVPVAVFLVPIDRQPVLIALGSVAAALGCFALATAVTWSAAGALGYPRRRAAAIWYLTWTVLASTVLLIVTALLAMLTVQLGYWTNFWVGSVLLANGVGSLGWNWIDGRRSDRFDAAPTVVSPT